MTPETLKHLKESTLGLPTSQIGKLQAVLCPLNTGLLLLFPATQHLHDTSLPVLLPSFLIIDFLKREADHSWELPEVVPFH